MSLQLHKNLKVWQDSIDLVKCIYSVTTRFPKEELYGLVMQLRRTAVSIPSNIAEGAARSSNKEFIHFLYISLGSIAELDTQLLIAEEVGFLEFDDHQKILEKTDQIGKMLSGLISYRKSKSNLSP